MAYPILGTYLPLREITVANIIASIVASISNPTDSSKALKHAQVLNMTPPSVFVADLDLWNQQYASSRCTVVFRCRETANFFNLQLKDIFALMAKCTCGVADIIPMFTTCTQFVAQLCWVYPIPNYLLPPPSSLLPPHPPSSSPPFLLQRVPGVEGGDR